MWREALQAGSEVAGGDRGVEHTPERSPRHAPKAAKGGAAVVFLEARIGAGAATEVWRAHSAAGRLLAVKRFTAAERAAQAHWLLEREALLLSRFAHATIVGTHGVLAPGRIAGTDGSLSDRPALALEYLGGGDLVVLAGSHPGHWARAARRVLEAIACLHTGGYVHGDIKARNVMLDSSNEAKLIDFSSCLPIGATCAAPIGTPSQQRVRSAGHKVSEDDDVFAGAALVFELLAGHPPFADESARASLRVSAVPQRANHGDAVIADLLDVVCGMLRSTRALGAAELNGLAAALAAIEHISAVE